MKGYKIEKGKGSNILSSTKERDAQGRKIVKKPIMQKTKAKKKK
jgi:hypothetical protein